MRASVAASRLPPLEEEPRSKLQPAAVSAAAEANVPVMSVRRRIVMVGPFRGILISARSGFARRGYCGRILSGSGLAGTVHHGAPPEENVADRSTRSEEHTS